MGRLRYRASTRLKLTVATLAGALLTAPIAVLASHQFSDVPTGHPFHREIGVVADAGIARGFDDGTYRPSANLTRQAMAAFLARAVGRIGHARGSHYLGNSPGLPSRKVIASVGMAAGATGGPTTHGYVQVTVTATVYADAAALSACPCRVDIALAENGTEFESSTIEVPGVADEVGQTAGSTSLQRVAALRGDQTASYQVVAKLEDTDVDALLVTGDVTALYVPLGPAGDDSLAYFEDCESSESEPNGTTGTADALGAAECVLGSLGEADYDFYAVSVPTGELRAETMSWDGAGCEGATRLTLYDGSGFFISADTDSGVGECSLIVQSGIPAGTYFVSVEAVDLNHGFDYRLLASATP